MQHANFAFNSISPLGNAGLNWYIGYLVDISEDGMWIEKRFVNDLERGSILVGQPRKLLDSIVELVLASSFEEY